MMSIFFITHNIEIVIRKTYLEFFSDIDLNHVCFYDKISLLMYNSFFLFFPHNIDEFSYK